MRKTLLSVALLLAALALVALLAPPFLQTVPPERVAGVGSFVDRIWWPATAVRLGVYAGLAGLVFPWLVHQRLADVQREQAQLDLDSPSARATANRLALQRAHLARVLNRARWVFIAFLVSDGVLAQLPYYLLRGS